MSSLKPIGAFLALGIASLTGAAEAKMPPLIGWQMIGSGLIENGSNSQRIYTGSGRGFDQLRICASRAPLKLRDANIVYRDGAQQDAAGWQTLSAGTCTRKVDLNGRARHIRYVQLAYERTYRGTLAPMIKISAR